MKRKFKDGQRYILHAKTFFVFFFVNSSAENKKTHVDEGQIFLRLRRKFVLFFEIANQVDYFIFENLTSERRQIFLCKYCLKCVGNFWTSIFQKWNI